MAVHGYIKNCCIVTGVNKLEARVKCFRDTLIGEQLTLLRDLRKCVFVFAVFSDLCALFLSSETPLHKAFSFSNQAHPVAGHSRKGIFPDLLWRIMGLFCPNQVQKSICMPALWNKMGVLRPQVIWNQTTQMEDKRKASRITYNTRPNTINISILIPFVSLFCLALFKRVLLLGSLIDSFKKTRPKKCLQ